MYMNAGRLYFIFRLLQLLHSVRLDQISFYTQEYSKFFIISVLQIIFVQLLFIS